MTNSLLLGLAASRKDGVVRGITSVCSAHPIVIGAALALGKASGSVVLIEATCNQVNQDGGYTGMTPADFRKFVGKIAANEGFDPARLILGGDHLGPNPWTYLPADQAMAKARIMISAYARAGFRKLHLDCSMPCRDDPPPLPEDVIAGRNAELAATAEAHRMAVMPAYVIGTEVPIPGGALELVDHLKVTTPDAAKTTVALHKAAFAAKGIATAFDRIVGLVVQPGVEFGNENVVAYDPAAAKELSECLASLPMLFEAHSTDYQSGEALAALVRDGFAILKVGPGLTFALREALYALDHIADEMFAHRAQGLRNTMEQVMSKTPEHWEKYYSGAAQHQKLQRHFSYSDRIRYYWTDPAAEAAVADLMLCFNRITIPATLISQYFGRASGDVIAGKLAPTAGAMLRHAVTSILVRYDHACGRQSQRNLPHNESS